MYKRQGSKPIRLRGLKFATLDPHIFATLSKPIRLRGLKLKMKRSKNEMCTSKPIWLRGLKSLSASVPESRIRVEAYTASWIEIFLRQNLRH